MYIVSFLYVSCLFPIRRNKYIQKLIFTHIPAHKYTARVIIAKEKENKKKEKRKRKAKYIHTSYFIDLSSVINSSTCGECVDPCPLSRSRQSMNDNVISNLP